MAAELDFRSKQFRYFDPLVPKFPTKFRVSWPFGSADEEQNRFSRWWLSKISHQNNFLLILIYKSPRYFLLSFESISLSAQGKKRKMDFPRWRPCRPFWISDRNDFSFFFYLQVTPMLLIKFQVIWPLVSGGEVKKKKKKKKKNRFSRWRSWRPSYISDQTDLGFFDLQVIPRLPTKFGVNWPFGSGEESKKKQKKNKKKNRLPRWPSWRQSWISDWNDCFMFLLYMSPRCFLPSFKSYGLSGMEGE